MIVDAESLDTGIDERDRDMHALLESATFGSFEFELRSFDPDAPPPAGGTRSSTASGTADGMGHGIVHGRMKIHGSERDFAMPITVDVDASHRLVIEGSAPLRLSDFGVTAPSKLGLVKMEDEITVWVVLHARPGAEVE